MLLFRITAFGGVVEQLESAIDIAKRAGAFIMEMKGHARVSEKALNDLVTEADTGAQKMIEEALLKQFPQSRFFGEEDEKRAALDSENLWIIDPLDGTSNFAHGIPHYCVSIAYASKGVVLCGCVYDAERGELFSAVKGEGAWLNGKKINVTDCTSLQQAIVSVGFYYDRGELMEKTLCSIQALFKKNIRGVRRLGSAAIDLSWLACGRFDAYFEYFLSPWDYAAGMLILQEAGGSISDRDGNSFALGSTGAIASNGRFHEELVSTVRYRGMRNRFSEQ
jgi:myo-inositol-1(or 4)-monophosphatase